MFKKMQNLETAFHYVRMVSMGAIGGCLLLTAFVIYNSYSLAQATHDKIYVLANGKVLEAFAAERKDNLTVEAKDHVKMFHHYFFSLSPDENVIQSNITRSLYMADASAKRQYDNLTEGNYYSKIISGNVQQTIKTDSIHLDLNTYPYFFRHFATQELTRPTSIVLRRLITEGYLRNVTRSENNPHGFLIEKWNIVDNQDIQSKNR